MYDEIGNMVSDVSEEISNIEWNVYGKITSIEKLNDPPIYYSYDPSGNRISKTVLDAIVTIYVRDASGNVMAVYKSEQESEPVQEEVHLYGSSRLGIQNAITEPPIGFYLDGGFGTAFLSTFTRGEKIFELSNHLGNVLETVNDKKIAFDDDADDVIDYYEADVVSANDYAPGGMDMPGRQYSSTTDYRYGFNGKEKDNKDGVVQYDYGFRIYDPRLVRFKSVDPLCKSYPMLTPYQFASNSPIFYIDIDGMEGGKYRIPGSETMLLPTNAIVTKTFAKSEQRNLMGFDTKVNVKKGELQSFQIGKELYEANYNVKTGGFTGYYSGNKKYVPEVEPNIGIVMAVDAAIGEQYIPLNPPQDRTWEMPAIFDYDKALNNDMTPDAYTKSLGGEGQGPVYGGGIEGTATTIVKGPDASIFDYYSYSVSTGPSTSTDVSGSIGGGVGAVWSLNQKNGFVYTRDMIEGPQISGSLSFSLSAEAAVSVNVGIDISYDGSILESAVSGKKLVNATSITLKGGAAVGADATPGPGASGSIRYGQSSAAWHPSDLLKK